MSDLGDRMASALSDLAKDMLADNDTPVRDPGGLAATLKRAGHVHAMNETTAGAGGFADLLALFGHRPAGGSNAAELDVERIIDRYADGG